MNKLIPTLAAVVLLAGCASGPTVTVTATAPAASASSEEPSAEPTEEPSDFTDEDLGDMLSPEDFKIKLKTISKTCFGSAGCNIVFRIDPSYVGPLELPSSGETEVSYKVKGGEDPLENTFTIDADGTAHFDSREMISTSSPKKKLSAVVTDVYWSE